MLMLAVACLMGGVSVAADGYSAKVTAVPEGDVLQVKCDGETKTIRVTGVDCPEMAQPYGPQAQKFTSGLVLNKDVTITPKIDPSSDETAEEEKEDATDEKWVIATVTFDTEKDLSREIVAAGMGWTYEEHKPFDKALRGVAAKAIVAKKGLWSDPAPLAPWDFRADELKKKKEKTAEVASIKTVKAETVEQQDVYITKNGDEYHKAGCVKLDKSMKIITVEQAERLGYSPCPLCFPPKADEDSVALEAKGPYENVPPKVFKKPKVEEARQANELAKFKNDPLYKELNPTWKKDANGNVTGLSADNLFANPMYGPIAASFGFQKGDVLHSVNGTVINSEAAAMNFIQQNGNQRNFQVEIIRNGQPQTLNITIPDIF